MKLKKLKEQEIKLNEIDNCVCSSLLNGREMDLDISFGTPLFYDDNIGKYDGIFSYHVFNIDDEDNIYDNFYALDKVLDIERFKRRRELSEMKVKVIDGSKFSHKGGKNIAMIRIADRLQKVFGDKYDVIYLLNYGFRNDLTTPYCYDWLDKHLDALEEFESRGNDPRFLHPILTDHNV